MNNPRMTAHEVAAALGNAVETLSETLLGPRNRAHSTAHEWRWNNKGSLSVVIKGDRAGKFFDHEAGTGGDALELVKVARGCGTVDAITWSLAWLGISGDLPPLDRPRMRAKQVHESDELKRDHAPLALATWNEAKDLAGTVVETYLRHRGIDLPDVVDLRFHPACPVKTAAGSTITLPAMLGLFRDLVNNIPVGIHRTFLRADGAGKVDPAEHGITNAKMMLGASKHAAIKLCDDDEVETGLGVTEGIENALTLIATGWRPIWALGSAGAIRQLPVIDGIEHLTIFADADDGGVGVNAAETCAARWVEAGKRSTLHIPPAGKDWNETAARVAA